MAITTRRIEAGRYQVVGTSLYIEKNPSSSGWGPGTEWFVTIGDDVLFVTRSKQECIQALHIVSEQLGLQRVDA